MSVSTTRLAAQHADDVCTLIYTSGTTGIPKAVMLSHTNITWVIEQAGRLVDVRAGEDMISYLPLSHVAEQLFSLHASIVLGTCIWFAESLETLGDTLRDVRPHHFLGVPRVWEKIQGKMEAAGAQSSAVQRKIVGWARRVGLAGGYADQRGESRPLMYAVADRLVFSKVRKRLGFDRARTLITGAAPISTRTLEFFLSLGLPICEVYGMSECTAVTTFSSPAHYRTGKAGSIIRAPKCASPPTARSACAGRTSSKAITTIPLPRPRRSMPTAGSTRATSARSTPRDSSKSPIARRSSSSPPAERTSRRSWWRVRSSRLRSSARSW